ncbi:MAG TPA: hypothetical protein VIH21_12295, partial [Dehalococcoidia bacterium]
ADEHVGTAGYGDTRAVAHRDYSAVSNGDAHTATGSNCHDRGAERDVHVDIAGRHRDTNPHCDAFANAHSHGHPDAHRNHYFIRRRVHADACEHGARINSHPVTRPGRRHRWAERRARA